MTIVSKILNFYANYVLGVSLLDKLHNDSCHVISAYPRGLHKILRNYFVEHLLNTQRHQLQIFILVLLLAHRFVQQVDALLVGQAIPDAVAGQHNELVVHGAHFLLYLRKASHHLLFIALRGILFVFKIPQAARQIKTPIHSVILHMTTSCNNPL